MGVDICARHMTTATSTMNVHVINILKNWWCDFWDDDGRVFSKAKHSADRKGFIRLTGFNWIMVVGEFNLIFSHQPTSAYFVAIVLPFTQSTDLDTEEISMWVGKVTQSSIDISRNISKQILDRFIGFQRFSRFSTRLSSSHSLSYRFYIFWWKKIFWRLRICSSSWRG